MGLLQEDEGKSEKEHKKKQCSVKQVLTDSGDEEKAGGEAGADGHKDCWELAHLGRSIWSI